MANGKPGDDPVRDVVVHGREVFGAEIDALIRRVVDLGGESPLRTGRLDELLWSWHFHRTASDAEMEEASTLLRDLVDGLERGS